MAVASCGDDMGKGTGAVTMDYQDPLHPQYMATPTVVHFPEEGNTIHLTDADYEEFKEDLQGFLTSNNNAEYERHFRDYYIPETFPTDSMFDLYVRMWGQWDSIGVSTRFDHWKVLYVSPFFPGEVYDIALAEVHLRHHIVFQKRWTGNYRNFGRTLGERYPGASITYMDTTYVDLQGDTILKRHITAESDRLLYAVRAHTPDELRQPGIRWVNDGWQRMSEVVALFDSTSVALADLHREENGTLAARPLVSGR